MKKACAFAVFSIASGVNIVNPSTGKCLDLYLPCKDGSEKKGCERVKPSDAKHGTNLQLYKCHDNDNQKFEYLDNGRIRNPLTGLCIDMQAPCADGSTKDKCKRLSNDKIGKTANLQLWDCHKDTGKLSSSYGNQKWHFTEDGELRNTGAKLCIDVQAKMKPDGTRMSAAEAKNMANLQVYTCHKKGNQIFDFETGGEAAKMKPQQKFTILPDGGSGFLGADRQSKSALALPAVGVCGLLVAAFIGVRARRSGEQAVAE
jgi:hypothetical protein